MFEPIDFDPALVGLRPAGGGKLVYGADFEPSLETKAAVEALAAWEGVRHSPAESVGTMLGDMMVEMRAQFEIFQAIRKEAATKLASGDEAEQKIAKTDAKSASDALSLIVRTIEKLDSLQRSLARDREAAAEQVFDQSAYDAMLADIERRIDARATERMAVWLAERGLSADSATGPPAGTAAEGA